MLRVSALHVILGDTRRLANSPGGMAGPMGHGAVSGRTGGARLPHSSFQEQRADLGAPAPSSSRGWPMRGNPSACSQVLPLPDPVCDQHVRNKAHPVSQPGKSAVAVSDRWGLGRKGKKK